MKERGAFTPGPWEVRFRFGRQTTVSGHQHYPICDTGTAPVAQANHRREEANARLISAAPDLYEALKAVLNEFEPGVSLSTTRAAGLAAILKAEGREDV